MRRGWRRRSHPRGCRRRTLGPRRRPCCRIPISTVGVRSEGARRVPRRVADDGIGHLQQTVVAGGAQRLAEAGVVMSRDEFMVVPMAVPPVSALLPVTMRPVSSPKDSSVSSSGLDLLCRRRRIEGGRMKRDGEVTWAQSNRSRCSSSVRCQRGVDISASILGLPLTNTRSSASPICSRRRRHPRWWRNANVRVC